MSKKVYGLGLIGCGAFGRFCVHAYQSLPDVRLVAAAETLPDTAGRFSKEFGVEVYHHSYELIAREDVDIIHIATPPSTHRDLVLQCFVAHKHVLCEKPLAINVSQGNEMLEAAGKIGTILPVNFVMRHNQVSHKVKELVTEAVLGEVISGHLVNCATDSHLPPTHWFWNKELAGGIFIEHTVHFFDLYRWWLGEGHVVRALAATRPKTEQEDRVMCTTLYDSGAIVTQYHGFDQLAPMDRTDHRLICELGDIRVEGWVPLKLTIDAVLDSDGLERLRTMLGAKNVQAKELDAQERDLSGRGKRRSLTWRAHATWEPNADKSEVYAQSVRDLMADQLAYLHNHKHRRQVVEEDGLTALEMAEQAKNKAMTNDE